MKERERVVVYIDGSNTYNKLKKLGLPEEGKRVEYIGFAGTPSLGMIKECSSQRLFATEDLLSFQYLKEVEQ